MMLSNQIRQTFLDYFARNGHRVVNSSSLIPYGDKTILFTNAGMNQFKNAFLGLEKRDYTRAATSQKVMRVSGKHNDLENVGPSKRHHTFFEMLGNFSFGDYFKEDAMKFALELLEKEYGFERDRMWFTVYKDDDESYQLWQKHGISPARVLRFGEKDNFWRMGATGPCGPNSEIHYFTGDLKNNDAKWVNNDDDLNETTVEIWNLVFMQFNQTETALEPLPQTGVDTGMGFERLVRLLQKGENNYDTDLFMPMLEKVQQLAHQTDAQREDNYVPYRVIADHVRAASFLIGDGVLPGNEGRNYVLRMVMRRAMRYGRDLGFEEPFLYKVAESVIDKMGDYYTELKDRRQHILNTIHAEEERFERTLDQGLERLNALFATTDDRRSTPASEQSSVVGGQSSKIISGADAFKLYDTFGLPVEITRDVAKINGYIVDDAGFDAAREAAKDVARSAGKDTFVGNFDAAKAHREAFDMLVADGKLPQSGVNYNPYGALEVNTEIVAILLNGEMTDRAVPGDTFEVVLKDVPFYLESGGQVGDMGEVRGASGDWRMSVKGAHRLVPGFVTLVCEVNEGEAKIGDTCVATVDVARRNSIQRNHTATHLLQKALRTVLGTHVGQQGSLVAPDRLRFDFSHGAAMSRDEIDKVSDLLNDSILQDMPVWDKQESYKEAIAGGAMAFFSDKYGDVVRVVRIGKESEPVYSAELCGGTHVGRTGEIGSAIVVSEGALAAGVRRIEVLTGKGALEHTRKQAQQLAQIAHTINATPDNAAEQVSKVSAQLGETRKELDALRRNQAKADFAAIVSGQSSMVNGSAQLIAEVKADKVDTLREMSDWFREQHHSGVLVLGAVVGDKPALLVSVSADLNKKGIEAGKLIKEIAAIVGGSGGGRPTLAQAGGKDASKLPEALEKAQRLIQQASTNKNE